MDHFPNYSPETFRTLRNCDLMNAGTYEGKTFVRCIPPGKTDVERQANVLRALREIGEEGLCLSQNPDFGGDYLRVETNTKTYARICVMKS